MVNIPRIATYDRRVQTSRLKELPCPRNQFCSGRTLRS